MEQFTTPQLLRTALHSHHLAHGAKMVEFGGWEMPVQYEGIISEHHAVRQRVGLFDVSHMGRVRVEGEEAEAFLDYLTTNTIAGKPSGTATYSVLCHLNGGCVDDVLIYKQDETHFFMVVNASNRTKDLQHILKESKNFKVEIQDCYQNSGILALQGPKAYPLMARLLPASTSLPAMHFTSLKWNKEELILSHTGYTGAGGFEIYGSDQLVVALWEELIKIGKEYGIAPVGLGARDTLRLEKGYALYGHEITDSITPIESVAGWTVKWTKSKFIGKEALLLLKDNPKRRREFGLALIDPGVARAGYEVQIDSRSIGILTSGGYSPTLEKSIGIVLTEIPLQVGQKVDVLIRQRGCRAEVVSIPFV